MKIKALLIFKRYVVQTFLFSLFFAPLFFGLFWLMLYPLVLTVTEGLAIVGQVFFMVWLLTGMGRLLFEGLILIIEFVQGRSANRGKQKAPTPGIYITMKYIKKLNRHKNLVAQ
jgi:hypothetical protein